MSLFHVRTLGKRFKIINNSILPGPSENDSNDDQTETPDYKEIIYSFHFVLDCLPELLSKIISFNNFNPKSPLIPLRYRNYYIQLISDVQKTNKLVIFKNFQLFSGKKFKSVFSATSLLEYFEDPTTLSFSKLGGIPLESLKNFFAYNEPNITLKIPNKQNLASETGFTIQNPLKMSSSCYKVKIAVNEDYLILFDSVFQKIYLWPFFNFDIKGPPGIITIKTNNSNEFVKCSIYATFNNLYFILPSRKVDRIVSISFHELENNIGCEIPLSSAHSAYPGCDKKFIDILCSGFIASNGVSNIVVKIEQLMNTMYGFDPYSGSITWTVSYLSSINEHKSYVNISDLANFREFDRNFPGCSLQFLTNGSSVGFLNHEYVPEKMSTQFKFHVMGVDFRSIGSKFTNTPPFSLFYDAIHNCFWKITLDEKNSNPSEAKAIHIEKYINYGPKDPSLIDMDPFDFSSILVNSLSISKKIPLLLSNFLRHYFGSHHICDSLLFPNPNLLLRFINLIKSVALLEHVPIKKRDKFIFANIALLNSFVVILDENLIKLEGQKSRKPWIGKALHDLAIILPEKQAAYLYFNHLNLIYSEVPIKKMTQAMLLLFKKLDILKNHSLIIYSLQQLNLFVPLSHFNLSDVLKDNFSFPASTPINQIPPHLRSILFLHQAHLVTAALDLLTFDPLVSADLLTVTSKKIKSNEVIPNIIPGSKHSDLIRVALDDYLNYFQLVNSSFDACFSVSSTVEEFTGSLFFELFDNLIRISTPLYKFNQIAQVITPLIQMHLIRIQTKFVECFSIKSDQTQAVKTYLHFCEQVFISFSESSAALIQGGYFTSFEQTFPWLVRLNLSISEDSAVFQQLTEPSFAAIPNSAIADFIKNESSMDGIYLKYRPMFHKNLSTKIKEMDRIMLMIFARQSGEKILQEVFQIRDDYNSKKEILPFSPDLKNCLEQMIKIRNIYRSKIQKIMDQINSSTNSNDQAQSIPNEINPDILQQKAQIYNMKLRAIMLLRLNTLEDNANIQSLYLSLGTYYHTLKEKERPLEIQFKNIVDFILSDFHPNIIKKALIGQNARVQLTTFGFLMLNQIIKITPSLIPYLVVFLSSIKSFESLSVILNFTNLKKEEISEIQAFFTQILDFTLNYHNYSQGNQIPYKNYISSVCSFIYTFFSYIRCFYDFELILIKKLIMDTEFFSITFSDDREFDPFFALEMQMLSNAATNPLFEHCESAQKVFSEITSLLLDQWLNQGSFNPKMLEILSSIIQYYSINAEQLSTLFSHVLSISDETLSYVKPAWNILLYAITPKENYDSVKAELSPAFLSILNHIFHTLLRLIGSCLISLYDIEPKENNFIWQASEATRLLRSVLMSHVSSNKILQTIISSFDFNTFGKKFDDRSNELFEVVGILSVFGGNIEPLRPKTEIKIHTSKYQCSEYFYLSKNKNGMLCYMLPITSSSHPIYMNPDEHMSYSISLKKIDISYVNCEWILSGFDFFLKNPKERNMISVLVYMKCISELCQFSEFASIIANDPEKIKILSQNLQPIEEIWKDISYLFAQYPKKSIFTEEEMSQFPEISPFQVMQNKNDIRSFISPRIINDSNEFSVIIKFSQKMSFPGSIGIVTDSTDVNSTIYKLIDIQTGMIMQNNSCKYDENLKYSETSDSYTLIINPHEKTFSFLYDTQKSSVKIDFPKSLFNNYRILININSSIFPTIYINGSSENFDLTALPIPHPKGLTYQNEEKEIFSFNYPCFSWIDKILTDQTVLPSFSDISNLSQENKQNYENIYKTYFQKETYNLPLIPENSIIHPSIAEKMTPSLYFQLKKGYIYRLILRFSTLALIRIINSNGSLLNFPDVMANIFIHIIIPLEKCNFKKITKGEFPFKIKPIWSSNFAPPLLYNGIENELKKASELWEADNDLVTILINKLSKIIHSSELHLFSSINEESFFFRKTINTLSESATNNNWDANLFCNEFWKSISTSALEKKFNPSSNSWIFGTPFELLLLIMHLVLVSKADIHQITMKTILMICTSIQSPFIFSLLPFLFKFITTLPYFALGFSEFDHQYKKNLLVFTSLLPQHCSIHFTHFYLIERQHFIQLYQLPKILFSSFPEFNTIDISSDQTDSKCKLRVPTLNPHAIEGSYVEHLKKLAQIGRYQNTLKGFPFWKILMYWIRIKNGLYYDVYLPPVEIVDNCLRKIHNPSQLELSISLSYPPTKIISSDVYMMISPLQNFEEPIIIPAADFTKPTNVNYPDIFMSIIGLRQSWKDISINIALVSKSEENSEIKEFKEEMEIDLNEIHDSFVSDMSKFVTEWQENDSEKLLDILPLEFLSSSSFSQVAAVVKTSSLCLKYPESVVLLRALILYHINYICSIQKEISPQRLQTMIDQCINVDFNSPSYNVNLDPETKKSADFLRKYVPKEVWDTVTNYLSPDFLGKRILSTIAFNEEPINFIIVDRQAALRMVKRKKGNQSDSIIAQIAPFMSFRATSLRQKKRIWRVNFANEQAIDAGGPSRELLTLAANSIFEETTKLFIVCPNGRKAIGNNRNSFLPFPTDVKSNIPQQFMAIGVLLGCLLRLGLFEDLPFSPFVWKFLAEENITIADIISVDEDLGTLIKRVENCSDIDELEWKIENWDGSPLRLSHHSIGEKISKDQIHSFSTEVLNARMAEIEPYLIKMREGLQKNLGIKHNSMLTGSLLSKLTQGSTTITLPLLKTVVKSFENEENEDIRRFWRVCERFTPEQLKLLLQFITTLPRLPNLLITDFSIQIDLGGETDSLPTASTCFCKLHLPHYTSDDICYQRFLTAISECVTMENN